MGRSSRYLWNRLQWVFGKMRSLVTREIPSHELGVAAIGVGEDVTNVAVEVIAVACDHISIASDVLMSAWQNKLLRASSDTWRPLTAGSASIHCPGKKAPPIS